MTFARGYVPDSEETLAQTAYQPHALRAAETPELQPTATMLRFRGESIWQWQVGLCVGAFIRRTEGMWVRANDPSSPDGDISDLGAYTGGRRRPYAGMSPAMIPALEDVGCEPGLALLAQRDVGGIARNLWPGPDHPDFQKFVSEYSMSGEDYVNSDPDDRALNSAFDMRGLEFLTIPTKDMGASLDDFREGCRAALKRFEPVGFAVNADGRQYQDNRGEIITDLGTAPPDHMNVMLAGDDPDFAHNDNWWQRMQQGIRWGRAEDGTWAVKWKPLYDNARQAFAVKAVPRRKVAP